MHFLEDIEHVFATCCGIHNLLHDYDGWDNWEDNVIFDEEDIMVEYDYFDEINILHNPTSIYYNFMGATLGPNIGDLTQ